ALSSGGRQDRGDRHRVLEPEPLAELHVHHESEEILVDHVGALIVRQRWKVAHVGLRIPAWHSPLPLSTTCWPPGQEYDGRAVPPVAGSRNGSNHHAPGRRRESPGRSPR